MSRRSISPIRYPKTKHKKSLKRHINSPSPEKIIVRKEHKKKRCTKPVWAGDDDENMTHEKLKVEVEVAVKQEPVDLLPYHIIQPMSQCIQQKKPKKSSSHKKRKVRTKNQEALTPADTFHRTALDIPVLGLSTYKVRGEGLIIQAIDAALEYGYRLFDTSAHCKNERHLGKAFVELLPKHGLAREDICIISKLDPSCYTYEDAMESAETTLQDLATDYLDVILLFWPVTTWNEFVPAEDIMMDCYRALEDLHAAGKVREIGVYKFNVEQLTCLLRRCAIVPAMLQAEFHPYLYQRSLVDLCRVNSIRMQAFCFIRVMQDPVINKLAEKYCKAPAQIILRWIVQHGVGVLPKSKTPSHIRENAEIFDFSLDSTDMEWINSLNQDRSFTPHYYRD